MGYDFFGDVFGVILLVLKKIIEIIQMLEWNFIIRGGISIALRFIQHLSLI